MRDGREREEIILNANITILNYMTPNIKNFIIIDDLHMRKMKEKESTGPVWDQPVHPSTRSPTDRENTPAQSEPDTIITLPTGVWQGRFASIQGPELWKDPLLPSGGRVSDLPLSLGWYLPMDRPSTSAEPSSGIGQYGPRPGLPLPWQGSPPEK